MRNGIVKADAGTIISLVLVDKLYIPDKIFDKVKIAINHNLIICIFVVYSKIE